MRDRLAAVGGELAIVPAPGSGTRVIGRIPLAASARVAARRRPRRPALLRGCDDASEDDGDAGTGEAGSRALPRRAARARGLGAPARLLARRAPLHLPGDRCTASSCGSAATWSSRATTARRARAGARARARARPTAPSSTCAAERRDEVEVRARASRSGSPAARACCSTATARPSTTPWRAPATPGEVAAGRSGHGAATPCLGDRRARAGRACAARPRRRRLRPPHVPVRPVGLGQELLARRGARAAARVETDLRIVILDPNSDFVRLGRAARGRRPGARPSAGRRWRRRRSPSTRRQRRGRRAAAAPLRRRSRPPTQAALLRLDPVADREEYAELAALLAEGRPERVARLAASDRPEARAARRSGSRNLGVERLGRLGARATPARRSTRSTTPTSAASSSTSARSPTREEQALVAEAVLGGAVAPPARSATRC